MPSSSESPDNHQQKEPAKPFRTGSDLPFYICFGLIASFYLIMILSMLVAESTYTTPAKFFEFLNDKDIQYSIKLSFFSCAITTLLSLCVAVPIGYLMSRHHFWGKSVVDAILDIPIVLPPLVIGLCLLILFNSAFAVEAETFLHGVEKSIRNNLIPIVFSLFLMSLGVISSYLLRRHIPRRSLQIAFPVVLTFVGMLIFTNSYLFPKLPGWVPDFSESGLQQKSITFRDQHPVTLSHHVYSSEYSYEGTGEKLVAALTKQWEEDASLNDDIKTIPQLGRDGTETGEQILITTFEAGIDSRFPNGGEMELRLVPQKPVLQLAKLQTELTKIHNRQEPLQQKYQLLRGQLDLQTELSVMRDQLTKVKKHWKSDSLMKSLSLIEGSLSQIEQAMRSAQQEIDTLQTSQQLKKIETKLKQQIMQKKRNQFEKMKENINQLLALKSKINENEQQLREILTERETLSNLWRKSSIHWSVFLEVMRPQLLSEKDISPTLVAPVTYAIPGVILAQFMVACAFAVRTMRVTFDQIHPRFEQVAQTLGCNSGQAFWRVVFPQARRGLMAAATLAWARSLGEFGPILIFAGTIPQKTEVLPSSVFLQFTIGNISGAVSASLIIIFAALIVLIIARILGLRKMSI